MYESGRRRQTGGKTQSTAAPFAFGFTNVRSPRRGLIICRLEAFEEMSAGADLALCFLRGSTAWMTAWERAAGSRPDDDMVREGVKGEELLMTKDAAKRGGRTAPRVPTWRIALAVGLLAFVCSLTPWPAWAQDRVALVMGNSAYSSEAALPNPTNDAEAMGAALEPLGFQVITVLDAGREEMENALSAFGDLAAEAQVALVFYAGHGGEVDGFGYLLPVDAQLERGPDVQREGVGVDAAIAATFGAQTRIVILDACRQNPFAVTRSVRVEGQGQTRELQPTTSDDGELLIAYATDRGGCPDDGPPGGNSPYTQALLEQLGEEPGVEIGLLFRRVAAAVFEATDGLQQPAVYLTLRDEFYLSAREQENLFWQSIMNSQNPAEFEAYLAQFPNGVFRALAEARLAALRPPGGAGDDHGDSREAATRVALESATPGMLEEPDDTDYFQIEVRTRGSLLVETTGLTDTVGRLVGSGASIDQDDADDGDENFRIRSIVSPGTHYVRVRGYDDTATGSYMLHVSHDDDDHSDIVETATRIELGSSTRGVVETRDDRDTFRIDVPTAGVLTVETTGNTDTVGVLVGCGIEDGVQDDDGGASLNFWIREQVVPDVCFVSVSGIGTGSYTLHVAFVAASGGDAPRRPGDVFRECDECPEMVVLPGGGLAMGRYEVTVGEYRAFASATGGTGDDSWRDHDSFSQTDRHPVTWVSWDDAQEYLSWLSRRTGATYRLPTEAEWERAAAGSQPGCDQLGRGTRPNGTCLVGSYGSNTAGLSDMVGNLWEWTSDCGEGNCGRRVVRGGSWYADALLLRPGARSWTAAANRLDDFGFRVSRTLD